MPLKDFGFGHPSESQRPVHVPEARLTSRCVAVNRCRFDNYMLDSHEDIIGLVGVVVSGEPPCGKAVRGRHSLNRNGGIEGKLPASQHGAAGFCHKW